MTNTEGGTDDEEFRVAAIKDRVDTTAQVWMGLTMGCAKCHSHKYDPITHEEYYRFYAFFNQSADNDQPDEGPVIPAPTAKFTAELEQFERRVAALRAKLEASSPALTVAQTQWEASLKPAGASARKGLPKEVLAILDTTTEKRTQAQSRAMAAYFHSIAPELKPVRISSPRWRKPVPSRRPFPSWSSCRPIAGA